MKITPSFTHPQAILGEYDFLLSDEHNQSYINKYPDASKLETMSMKLKKVHPSRAKCTPHSSGGLIKAFCSKAMHLCKKNIHI